MDDRVEKAEIAREPENTCGIIPNLKSIVSCLLVAPVGMGKGRRCFGEGGSATVACIASL